MTSIERTAYPRFPKSLGSDELELLYQLTAEDEAFIQSNANTPPQQLTIAAMLKTRQFLGYFPQLSAIPVQIVEYLQNALSLPKRTSLLIDKRHRTSRYYYRNTIRTVIGCKGYPEGGSARIRPMIETAAYTMSDPADLINVAIEYLAKENIELPAFSTLDRLVSHTREDVHEKLYAQVTTALTDDDQKHLKELMLVLPGQQITGFTMLKQSPGPPTVNRVKDWVSRLERLDNILTPARFLEGLAHTKIRQFAAEASAYAISDIRNMRNERKRQTLLLCLLHQAQTRTRDDLAEMFIKRMKRTRNAAYEEMRSIQEKHREIEETLISVLGRLLQNVGDNTSDETLGRQTRQVVEEQGGVDCLADQFEAVSAYHQNNYLPLLWRFHIKCRPALFNILELLQIEPSTQDTSLYQAINFIKEHRYSRSDTVPNALNLGFASQRWLSFMRTRHHDQPALDRRALEVCVFIHIAEALQCCDLYVKGSEAYTDYRQQLLPWEKCLPRLKNYCAALNMPDNGKDFVAHMREQLLQASAKVDACFPDNTELSIDADGKAHLKRQAAAPLPEELNTFEDEIQKRMPERHLLDVLKHTNHWAGYTEHFGPPSGSEPKFSDATQRYLFAVFGYGCGLGPGQTARHAPGAVNPHTMRRINAQHINTKKLTAAHNDLIAAYTRFDLPRFWGGGEAAIADGTHIELRVNNLKGERHIRYGGYGGIAYNHIADNYIALFSNFIACGVWEAVYILDALMKNTSVIQPDTLYADTHGQSEPVFGLAGLLGIKLFPRMRTWNDVTFYKADKSQTYKHIDKLFSAGIDWQLIETHWQDMMQVILSIQAGHVLPSMLLRKLRSNNRKNMLYRAFRELGRVERTLFLLRYISNEDLRFKIRAETTKIESYNDFLDWISFGGAVIKSGDPIEQEKTLKYMNLVANAIMLQNVVDLTDVLNSMSDEGFVITERLLKCLSPYMRRHLLRFGWYSLDMEDEPPPLEPKIIPIAA